MMEGLREALQFITDLKEDALEPKIVEIAEKTYCNQSLVRYGKEDLAEAITASTLTSIVDYIKQKSDEMRESSNFTYRKSYNIRIILWFAGREETRNIVPLQSDCK